MIKTAKITSNTIVTGLINNPPYIYFLEQNSENIVSIDFGKKQGVCMLYLFLYTGFLVQNLQISLEYRLFNDI